MSSLSGSHPMCSPRKMFVSGLPPANQIIGSLEVHNLSWSQKVSSFIFQSWFTASLARNVGLPQVCCHFRVHLQFKTMLWLHPPSPMLSSRLSTGTHVLGNICVVPTHWPLSREKPQDLLPYYKFRGISSQGFDIGAALCLNHHYQCQTRAESRNRAAELGKNILDLFYGLWWRDLSFSSCPLYYIATRT